MDKAKELVNSKSLTNCKVVWGDHSAKILDVSFVRVVIEASTDWLEKLEQASEFRATLNLQGVEIPITVMFQTQGEGWIRLGIIGIVPSARATLKSFLVPKKVGESIVEDWRTDQIRHFHGLNESELWVDTDGSFTFLYLDQEDFESQFIVRLRDLSSSLRVGTIKRKDYLDKMDMSSELPLNPLEDKETYGRLSECRDIVTNFRPTGQMEFHLKQKLLKVLSDYLYSSPRKLVPVPAPITRSSPLLT